MRGKKYRGYRMSHTLPRSIKIKVSEKHERKWVDAGGMVKLQSLAKKKTNHMFFVRDVGAIAMHPFLISILH